MSKKRTTAAANLTKTQIGDAVEKFAHAKARLDHLTAKMNKECDAIRDGYREQLEAHIATMREQEAVCESWAKANRDIEFGKKQSIEFVHGTLVFRLGNIRLKLPSSVTEAEAIAHLREYEGTEKYIRTPAPELNKDALIADRQIINRELLRLCGITFPQTERFYVEPRLDDPVPAGG